MAKDVFSKLVHSIGENEKDRKTVLVSYFKTFQNHDFISVNNLKMKENESSSSKCITKQILALFYIIRSTKK